VETHPYLYKGMGSAPSHICGGINDIFILLRQPPRVLKALNFEYREDRDSSPSAQDGRAISPKRTLEAASHPMFVFALTLRFAYHHCIKLLR